MDDSRATTFVIAIFGTLVSLGGLLLNAAWLRTFDAGPYAHFSHVCAIVSTPLDLLLLVGSVGLFRRNRWARRWMRRWGVLAIVYATIRVVVAITWLASAETAAARLAATGKAPAEFSPEFEGMMVQLLAVGFWIATMILPVSVLAVLKQPARKRPSDQPVEQGDRVA